MEFNAAAVAQFTRGEVIAGNPQALAVNWSFDTRTMGSESGFFALTAERDGHEFVDRALAQGATVVIVSHLDEDSSVSPINQAVVRVGDPAIALRDLAIRARHQLMGAVAVGITGSAGKTTTKDLASAAISTKKNVHANIKSFNNEVGTPLTLLSAPSDTEVLITEMGARFAGNITDLSELVQPQIGVITQVGMAHAEHLKGRSGITTVKGELLAALPTTGVAILNSDCDQSIELAKRTSARVLTVGKSNNADVVISDVVVDGDLRTHFNLSTSWGNSEVNLSLRGAHNVNNAAMAAAIALEIGVDLEEVVENLASVEPNALRMNVVCTDAGITIINDAYNSSPTSALAAIAALRDMTVPGRRWAVLGEMLELGDYSNAEHKLIGEAIADANIDQLIVVGSGAAAMTQGATGGDVLVTSAADSLAAISILDSQLESGDAVLVKASRAIGLEVIADHLIGRLIR